MAILTDLITMMTSDSSINSAATGGIVYDHLPTDFDSSKDWIVFSYTNVGNTDTLISNNVISEYNLSIQVASQSIEDTITISNRLVSVLVNYRAGGIGDIVQIDDDLDFNTEKNIYYKTNNFNVLYRN